MINEQQEKDQQLTTSTHELPGLELTDEQLEGICGGSATLVQGLPLVDQLFGMLIPATGQAGGQ